MQPHIANEARDEKVRIMVLTTMARCGINRFTVVMVRYCLMLAIAILLPLQGPMAQNYGDESPLIELTSPEPYHLDASKDGIISDPQTLLVKNQSVMSAIENVMLLPSSWAGPYTLNVSAKDMAGNVTERKIPIYYDPVRAGLASEASGRIAIPAITQAVKGGDGRYPFTTQVIKRADGQPIQGTLPLKAAIKADSTVSLVVNGVKVGPGALVDIGSYNFTNSPQLSLPIAGAVEGAVGNASLIVLIGDVAAPVVEATVTTWSGQVTLSASAWTFRQAVDTVQIGAEANAVMPCRLVVSTTPNKQSDVCRLAYSKVPEGLAAGGGTTALTGRLWNLGGQEIAYTLYFFDGNSEVPISSGTRTITATSALGLLSFGPTNDVPAILRSIESVDVMMQQKSGPGCSLTTSVDSARAASTAGTIGCLLEWGELPVGITQDNKGTVPRLKGVLTKQGAAKVPWTVSFISPGGVKTMVAQGDLTLESKDPEVPRIAFAPTVAKDGERYQVPVSGGQVGDATVTAVRSVVIFEVVSGGVIQAQESLDLTRAREVLSSTRRKVAVGAAPIWDSQMVTLRAYYRDLPEAKSEYSFETIAVSAPTVKPVISANTVSALDTESLPVFVAIKDTSAPNKNYDANAMGAWRVRVVLLGAGSTVQPLTEYVDAVDGQASFSVSLATLGGTSARVSAQAQLVTAEAAQQRVEVSPRALNISVLRGGAIGSSVVAQRLKGAAPVTAAFQLHVDDQRDQGALGTIEWQISKDEGLSWTSASAVSQNKTRFSEVFAAGDYLVRAKLTNKNSKVYSFSEAVGVQAFNVPALTLNGPVATMVGATARYTAAVAAKNDASEPVVQWSTNGGQTWADGGTTFDVSSGTEAKVPLKVRVRSASSPADIDEAWVVESRTVEFLKVRPPGVRLAGPQMAETGKSAVFRASMTLPYPRMDGTLNGEWLLPDGTRVPGTEVSWVPSEADEGKGQVNLSFTGWVEGFRDAGAAQDSAISVRVWTYRWPNWQITVRPNYEMAPSEGQIRLGALGSTTYLQNVTYSWSVPAEVQMLDAGRDTTRKFRVDVPGEYPVAVTIQDGRGNASTVSSAISLKVAPELAMALDIRPANKFWRAPLDLMVLPKVTGGHPADLPTSFAYSVDGQSSSGGGTIGRVTMQEGEHALTVTVGTKMGQTVAATNVVTVNPNKPPTCAVQVTEGLSAWSYTATCSDVDGSLKSFRWFVDGEEQALRSNRISVSKRGRSEAPAVIVIGVDDGGAESAAALAR